MSLALFTDFGSSDIYVGQVKAVLSREAPAVPVLDLFHDAPAFDVEAGAHLLSALAREFPAGTVFFAVVDPGVGGSRAAAVVMADDKWFVGPDNGLLSIVAQRARHSNAWHITWRPERLSHSFHGRDLFAPIAAAIARGAFPSDRLHAVVALDVSLSPDPLPRVLYVDHYGNCITGIPAAGISPSSVIATGIAHIPHARTFSDAEPGRPCWYANSIGLLEVAVNGGNAANQLGLGIGSELSVH